MLILIGGGGFLGSHLRRRLSAKGAPEVVVVADNELPFPLMAHETQIGRQSFAGDIGKGLIGRATIIVYLATASTVATFVDAPWNELHSNVDPLIRLLYRVQETAATCKVVFVSSGGTVYGRTNCSTPIPETHPLQPISPYGFGKVVQEEAFAFFSRTNGLHYSILRLANPVGVFGRSHTQGLVTAALRAVASQTPLKLFGDGSHIRDLFDADDAAEAILSAASDQKFGAAVWNVGSGQGLSNMQVIEMVQRVTGVEVSLDRQPAREADVSSIVLDTSRIRADLGWTAARDLEETIEEIWQQIFRVK